MDEHALEAIRNDLIRLESRLSETENRLLAHQASAEALFLRGDDSRAARHMDQAILEATKAGNFKRREAVREEAALKRELADALKAKMAEAGDPKRLEEVKEADSEPFFQEPFV